MHYHKEEAYLVLQIDELYAGKTIQDLFVGLKFSKKTIHLLKQNKDYSINGEYLKSETILKIGDILKIKAYETGIDFIPQQSKLHIIYEDDILCIVEKVAHLIVHPDHKSKTNTLCNYVANYYKQTKQNIPVRYLHRLDEDTTGLVMFCKCSIMQPYFDALIASKDIKKTYIACISGHLPQKEMTLHTFIGEDRHSKNKMRVSKSGKESVTHFKEIKSNQTCTLVECTLETGRKHQIRVHLSHLGHPIIGDTLYGKKSKTRLALHAYRLQFIHPLTNKKMNITCDIPQDIRTLIH